MGANFSSFSIADQWKMMIRYLYDPILNNKCKEILYKIYTQVLPVGSNIEKFGYPSKCPFCDSTKDELHLFVLFVCSRVSQLWAWLDTYLLITHFSQCSDRLTPWEKLIGFNTKMMPSTIQVDVMESISC
jgi:hypothetical protein